MCLFYSETFIVLVLVFRSLINFVWSRCLILFTREYSVMAAPFTEKTFLALLHCLGIFIENQLTYKKINCKYENLFLDSQVYSIGLYICSYASNCTVLITVGLQKVLKLLSMSSPILFFKIVLAIWWSVASLFEFQNQVSNVCLKTKTKTEQNKRKKANPTKLNAP